MLRVDICRSCKPNGWAVPESPTPERAAGGIKRFNASHKSLRQLPASSNAAVAAVMVT